MIFIFCFFTGLIIAAIGSYFFDKGRGYTKSTLNKMLLQGSMGRMGGIIHYNPKKDRPRPELKNRIMIFWSSIIMAIGFGIMIYGFYSIPPYASSH